MSSPLAQRIATFLGVVLNPLVPGFPVALHAAVTHEGGLTPRLIGVALIVVLLSVGTPIGALLLAAKLAGTDDLWANRRRTRIYLYPAAGLGLVATSAVFTWVYPFALARIVVVAAGVVMAMMFAANRFTKVSIHCAANAGIGVATAYQYGWWALPFVVFVPAVAWARITTKHHTLVQTLAGTAIGALGTCACLIAWRYMGRG